MLLIYTPEISTRTDYIFELIFQNELGIGYTVTKNKAKFEGYSAEKINYSYTQIGDELFIKASSLLSQSSIEKIDVPVEIKDGINVIFPDNESDTGFDIFSAVFYMVSRYEEYLPFTPDTHGRFKASDSLAYRNGFLQSPVVNKWISLLRTLLSSKFPALVFRTSTFNSIITYDIDIAYAYKGRDLKRSVGGVARDIITLQFQNVLRRLAAHQTKKDPWDVYDHLEDIITGSKLASIFFFLVADQSRYDKNIPFDHPEMIELVQKVAAFSQLGIHPSYNSMHHPEMILMEKLRLEELSGKKIIKSRQHYLRFTLPGTYNHLVKAGIMEDYSMGFADMPGFRAGTCTPFYFYDLKNERMTALKIFPTTFMDANFLYYSRTPPEKGFQVIMALLDEVKKAGGTFISIWHNNTVSDHGIFKGWKYVHDEMIKNIQL